MKTYNIDGVKQEWMRYSKESIDVEIVDDQLFATGSELACLRLFKAYYPNGEADFSYNLGKWYFTVYRNRKKFCINCINNE